MISPEVSARVTDEIIDHLYNPLWKNDREKRKSRSFIREFWNSQQDVGDDNYVVFTIQSEKSKMKLRTNDVKQKLHNYTQCFQERESASIFCKELITIHSKTSLEIDTKHLEDLEFDRIIGKVTAQPNGQPLTDDILMSVIHADLPHVAKLEDNSVMDNHTFVRDFINSDKFTSKCLKMIVHDSREKHHSLRPQPPK